MSCVCQCCVYLCIVCELCVFVYCVRCVYVCVVLCLCVVHVCACRVSITGAI